MWPSTQAEMVEVTRAPALFVDLWSGLLTVLNVSGIGKIRYESPHILISLEQSWVVA